MPHILKHHYCQLYAHCAMCVWLAKLTLSLLYYRVKLHQDVVDADLLKPWQVTREKYKQRKKRLGDREKDTLAKLQAFTSALRSKDIPAASAGPPSANSKTIGTATAAQQNAVGTAREVPDAADAEDEPLYNGEVRKDIDHRAYMPAAWRVDDYLKQGDGGVDEDDFARLRAHKLVFAKQAAAGDAMARRDDVDDYVVFDPLLEEKKGKFSKAAQKMQKQQTGWAKRAQGEGAKQVDR